MKPVLLFVTVILIGLFPAMAQHELQRPAIRMFRFTLQLQRPPQLAGTLLLGKGLVLQPVDRRKPKLIYQSVILCKDVTLRFDGKGRSEPQEIEGFCYNPGLSIPPEDVEWQLTQLVSPEVEERCDRDIIASLRGQEKPSKIWTQQPPLRICNDKSREECFQEFDSWLRLRYRHGYDELRKEGKCGVKKLPNVAYSSYGLICDLS